MRSCTNAAASHGLTLQRFNTTALRGNGCTTTIDSLESIPVCVGGCSAPSGWLLTGQFAPPKAGRFGFELAFDPPIPFPSDESYARLWVDDHLLYPRNTTQSNAPGNAAPTWLPFPPRALDSDGLFVDVPGAVELGSYVVRAEYVCMVSGCVRRVATLRYAHYGDGDAPVPPIAPFVPIPASALLPASRRY